MVLEIFILVHLELTYLLLYIVNFIGILLFIYGFYLFYFSFIFYDEKSEVIKELMSKVMHSILRCPIEG